MYWEILAPILAIVGFVIVLVFLVPRLKGGG